MKKYLSALFVLSIFFACNNHHNASKPKGYLSIHGQTMGTTYHAMYVDTLTRDFTLQADSIFEIINLSMSTYIDTSLISRLNRDTNYTFITIDKHFKSVYEKARDVYELSNGAFNPAVMPLVNYWGFAYEDAPNEVDSNLVDSLVKLVDFNAFILSNAVTEFDTLAIISKTNPLAQLDFSAIAKGYAVDQFGLFLESKHIFNYMVEIGGEVRTAGLYGDKKWSVGIEEPSNTPVSESKLFQILSLSNVSAATSGNYRNQRKIAGKIYAHTINPFSGYPELNEVLSATVISNDCTTADALATACMVLGRQKALDMIKRIDSTEVFLIIHESDGFKAVYTKGFEKYLEED